jgi:hypothetical protein
VDQFERQQAAEERLWLKQRERDEREQRRQEVVRKPLNELTADDRRFAFEEGLTLGPDPAPAQAAAERRCDRPGVEIGGTFYDWFPRADLIDV